MQGHVYGEPEPKEHCPYCGWLCMADFCDIGVGFTQVGPYWCGNCKASQISPYQYADFTSNILLDGRILSPEELRTGWYAPESPPDSLANVDAEGRHIRHFEADTLYRESQGVAPRYDRYGNMIKNKLEDNSIAVRKPQYGRYGITRL